MFTTYSLKKSFQNLLRPVVNKLASAGITANQLTISAMLISIFLGIGLWITTINLYFILLPLWFLLRMALNAMDGMLAREHHQQSKLGAYLNEIGDVISDAALYAPFAKIPPFGWSSLCLIIFLSTLSELTGILGISLGNGRRYDGPMGKSDRALLFGIMGLVIGLRGSLPEWGGWIIPILALLLMFNIFNRIRFALSKPISQDN